MSGKHSGEIESLLNMFTPVEVDQHHRMVHKLILPPFAECVEKDQRLQSWFGEPGVNTLNCENPDPVGKAGVSPLMSDEEFEDDDHDGVYFCRRGQARPGG